MTKEKLRWRLEKFSRASDLTALDKTFTIIPYILSFIASILSYLFIQQPIFLFFSIVIAGLIVTLANYVTIMKKAIDIRLATVQVLTLGFLLAIFVTIVSVARFYLTAWSSFGILPRELRPAMDYLWIPVFLTLALILFPLRKSVSTLSPTLGCFPRALRGKIPGVIPAACSLGFSFSVLLYIPAIEGSSFTVVYPGLTLTFRHHISLFEPIIMIVLSACFLIIAYWHWKTKWDSIIESTFDN